MLRQSAAIDAANGRPASAENLADLADVLEHRGGLAAAGKAYRDALAASEASGEKTYAAYAHFWLGRLALLASDFAEAERQENEALRLRKELGETFSIAETEVALAELAIEQDHAAAAEAPLRQALEVFKSAGRRDDSALAAALLVRCLLLDGNTAEAVRTLDSIARPSEIEDFGARIAALLAHGRVDLALARLSAARNEFELALAQAQRVGSREWTLSARLGMLQAAPASTHRAAELQALSREAREAGFALLAASASRLILTH
jgi:tetratricopeptide (TPR) repeat protein